MTNRDTYQKSVMNFTGGRALSLEVFSHDGQVGIGLSDGDGRKCLMEVADAQQVITALNQAINDLNAK